MNIIGPEIKQESGNISENFTWKESWTYILDFGDNSYDPYLAVQQFIMEGSYPRVGSYHWINGFLRVNSLDFNDIKVSGDGKLHIILGVSYEAPVPKYNGGGLEEVIFPWMRGVENYTVEAEQIEEAMRYLYWIEGNQSRRIQFLTSAGTKLEATLMRNIASVSFSYALQLGQWDQAYVYSFRDKINIAPVIIAGQMYDTGTVKIGGLTATQDTFEWTVESPDGGDPIRNEVDYWNISVRLSIDPQSWWRRYNNQSTYFVPVSGSLAQIWCTESATKTDTSGDENKKPLIDYSGAEIKTYDGDTAQVEKEESKKHYGTYEQMTLISNTNLEAVTEPLFLFPNTGSFNFQRPDMYGAAVSAKGGFLPFEQDTGRQFLGTYSQSNSQHPKYGKWTPVVLDNNGNWTTAGQSVDASRVIHATYVEGFPSEPVNLFALNLPIFR